MMKALAMSLAAVLIGLWPAATMAYSPVDPHWYVGEELPNATTYLELARQAWNGQTPACGTPTTYNDWSGLELGSLAAVGEHKDDACHIYWWAYNRWQATDYGWCVTIVHEYGHLLGRDHNRNPRSVMYEWGPWYGHVPVCDRYRSPTGCTVEVTMHGTSYHPLCGNPRRRDEY